jgi:hypothetical protein
MISLRLFKTFLVPIAFILGVMLIPVAFVIAIPDFIRSMKDAYIE